MVELRENQVLLWPDDATPKVYFLFRGRLKQSAYSPDEAHLESKDRESMNLISFCEKFKEYKPFTVFGSLRQLQALIPGLNPKLQAQDWEPCFVYALQDTWLFSLKLDAILKI